MNNNHMLEVPDYALLYSELDKHILSNPDKKAALIFVEIDNFKEINISFGYFSRDRVVARVARVLQSLFHSEKYQIFRLCSDSFIIAFKEWERKEEIDEAAIMIIQSILDVNYIEGSFINIFLNIGISIYPDDGKTIEELLKCASIAVRKASNNGRNKYVYYKNHMKAPIVKKTKIEKHMHMALRNYEFEIYYQPQVKADTEEIVGFEALLRWSNPELGSVSPIEFINIAEENYLIVPIGEWVLRNACYFLKKLHNMGYENLTMSVNISVPQLLDDRFLDTIHDISTHMNIDMECLHLEITESVFRESYSVIVERLNLIREKGVKVALDDFGKGYSSLSELGNLPVDIIKIDKAFIDMINTGNREKVITGMIIKIVEKIGKEVIAEGVETNEQKEYLLENGCKILQGYLFSKPVPKEKVLELLPENKNIRNDIKNNTVQFVWERDYELNIPEIDKQHKKLFELGNKISNLVFSYDNSELTDEISGIFNELKNYAKYHFNCEENAMRKHKYVHYKTHRKEHLNFIKAINNIAGKKQKLIEKETLYKLIDFIYLWITNHILKSDMKYKTMYNNNDAL